MDGEKKVSKKHASSWSPLDIGTLFFFCLQSPPVANKFLLFCFTKTTNVQGLLSYVLWNEVTKRLQEAEGAASFGRDLNEEHVRELMRRTGKMD